jgi:hypothetical protein
MERVYFMEYKGKTILIEDFTTLSYGDEFLKAIAAARAMIASRPLGSALCLFDATDGKLDGQALVALKQFTQQNTPYVKCTVLVGISGFLHVGMFAVSRATGRSLRAFSNRQDALDYLATQ